MEPFVFVGLGGAAIAAWATAKIVRAQYHRQQEIDNLHARIDDTTRSMNERYELLERNLSELINNVQQELIRENASLIARFTPKK